MWGDDYETSTACYRGSFPFFIKFPLKSDKLILQNVLDSSTRFKAFARVGSKLHIYKFGRVTAYTIPSSHLREEDVSYAIRQHPFKKWKGRETFSTQIQLRTESFRPVHIT
jgi:hypothetical protein